ncbi:MAG: mechanosensitive ion channel family protein [Lachnotalea sp.]
MVIGALLVSSFAIFALSKYWERKFKDSKNEVAYKWIFLILKSLIWGIAVLLFFDNIGVEINSLITGLGIGGLAIAFASQTILEDIFCYFTIFFDRPFEIDDFIVAGEQMGIVEHIGVKTTRLRALSGEQLIFSNTDLTSSRIQNYKTMEQRRVLFTLGVKYDTTYDKLKEIPKLLKEIIENVNDTAFSRTHFIAYAEYSLNFEVAYYVLTGDYDKYMDIHQEVNLQIKKVFEQQQIEFAFPTQTLQLQNASHINTPESRNF